LREVSGGGFSILEGPLAMRLYGTIRKKKGTYLACGTLVRTLVRGPACEPVMFSDRKRGVWGVKRKDISRKEVGGDGVVSSLECKNTGEKRTPSQNRDPGISIKMESEEER